jgi:hypothetical protein
MRQNYLIKILFVAFLFLMNQSAKAFCDTIGDPNRYPTIEREYISSEYVLEGEVLSKTNISSSDDPIGYVATLYSVKPIRIFKGKSQAKFIIYSENTSSRFPMKIGERYIVFLQTSDDGLFVDNCGNSGAFEKSSAVISKVMALSRQK